MIHFNSIPAREYLTALRLCPNVKSKTNLAISGTSTTLSLLDGPTVLGVSPHSMNLLQILNDMNACGVLWRRSLIDQSVSWQDLRLTQVQIRYRSLKEIADLLETFWFTNGSLKNL